MNRKARDARNGGEQLELGLGLIADSTPSTGRHPGLRDATAVLQLLDDWHAAGWLQQLDVRFARFLYAEQPAVSGLLLLAAALASHQLGRGHVCLDLAATLKGPGQVLNLPPERQSSSPEAPLVTPAELLGALSLSDWEEALHTDVVSDGRRVTPLVYDEGRLYLYRYWRHEQNVAGGVAARVRAAGAAGEPDAKSVNGILDVLFGPPASGVDWQRLACALAARRRFAIVTGGPGTGKTTTVVRLLALLQALNAQRAATQAPVAPLRIQLAAPTGKAAARLSESIAAKVDELPLERLPGGTALAAAIPTHVATLHRLLGGRPHVQTRRYNADNPLPLDVLVIDEASMVSLSDMAHVMAALPPQAQLVLIGDKDQLSSVEAGAVLGELCRRAEQGHYLPATASWLEQATGMRVPADFVDPDGTALDQAVAMLRASHRFGEDSGIGRLAFAVNEGREDEALALLASGMPDLAQLHIDNTEEPRFSRLITDGYGRYLTLAAQVPVSDDPAEFDQWATTVLRAHRSFQILCVLRAGPWGVHGLNASIARQLHASGLIPSSAGWYAGRPVMVTRNNPALRLTNGDIGVALPYPAKTSSGRTLRVAFLEGDTVRWFAPNRLDDVETVYALTVHKSQGSEFHYAVLVLPSSPTPVLTRELVYTGITRASQRFTLVNPGSPGLLQMAIRQRVYRSGGLGDVLDALR